SRTASRSQRQFVLIHALHGNQRASEIIAHAGLRNIGVRSLHVKSILILVKICSDERPKVNRIRTGDESSVVMVGIKHLPPHSPPPAGGTAVGKARPALPD